MKTSFEPAILHELTLPFDFVLFFSPSVTFSMKLAPKNDKVELVLG